MQITPDINVIKVEFDKRSEAFLSALHAGGQVSLKIQGDTDAPSITLDSAYHGMFTLLSLTDKNYYDLRSFVKHAWRTERYIGEQIILSWAPQTPISAIEHNGFYLMYSGANQYTVFAKRGTLANQSHTRSGCDYYG